VRRGLLGLLVVLAAGCAGGSEGERLTLPQGESFVVRTSISPLTSAFGDPVTAHVRILLDRREVDPDRIRMLSFFRPWTDRTSVARVDQGNLTSLDYTIRLFCLTLSCTSPDQREISYGFGGRIVFDTGPVREFVFPDVTVVTRVPPRTQPAENTGEVDQWPPPWRAAVALPDATYRASPRLLTWVLGGLGALLVAASATAGVLLLRRGRLLREHSVPQLERALELLRSAGTPGERRAALEAVAVALERERDSTLAEPARALAWSEGSPSETEAAELAALAQEAR
jgi:hypothetical protein